MRKRSPKQIRAVGNTCHAFEECGSIWKFYEKVLQGVIISYQSALLIDGSDSLSFKQALKMWLICDTESKIERAETFVCCSGRTQVI